MTSMRKRQRGNTSLELILLLPTYVFILWVVIAMGEYGQVATQLYQTARLSAWQKSAPTPASVKANANIHFNHFKSRIDLDDIGSMFVPLAFDGTQNTGIPLTGCSGAELLGANSYGEGTTVNEPLYDATDGALHKEASDADVDAVAHMALDGDTEGADDVPWLRRRYVSVSVKYTPMGKFMGSSRFHVIQTVLRGKTYGTQLHKPYVLDLENKKDVLRDGDAYENKFYNKTENHHQMDARKLGDHLYPPPSMLPNKP